MVETHAVAPDEPRASRAMLGGRLLRRAKEPRHHSDGSLLTFVVRAGASTLAEAFVTRSDRR
jgi:hypothetical protein